MDVNCPLSVRRKAPGIGRFLRSDPAVEAAGSEGGVRAEEGQGDCGGGRPVRHAVGLIHRAEETGRRRLIDISDSRLRQHHLQTQHARVPGAGSRWVAVVEPRDVRVEAQARQGGRDVCKKANAYLLLLSVFPYTCPEPVLVK